MTGYSYKEGVAGTGQWHGCWFLPIFSLGTGIACWKSAGLEIKRLWVWIPAGAAGEFSAPELLLFFSPELTSCVGSYSVSSPPIKDPDHSAKSADDKLHLNTHTPLTQWSQSGLTMLSRYSVGTCQGNKFTCNSSGNSQPVISAHWATLDWSWAKKWDWCAQTDLHLKKNKQRKWGSINRSQKDLASEEKAIIF